MGLAGVIAVATSVRGGPWGCEHLAMVITCVRVCGGHMVGVRA